MGYRIDCNLLSDVEKIRSIYHDATVTMEREYLTLWIHGEIITQGESEVKERVKQIIRENGLQWE